MHHHDTAPPTDPAEFWDDLYRSRDQVWSGRPNQALVDTVGQLPPGRALDLGSGEGGDAIWLAERGWIVTAVDISAAAISRGAAAASRVGIGQAIDWQRHDLAETFPDGAFDLVSAQFLQSPIDFPRDAVLRRAAAAVAPGGHLLVVGHASAPSWSQHQADHHLFDEPSDVVARLALDDEWAVVISETRSRHATGPDGQSGDLDDSVVLVRREATAA